MQTKLRTTKRQTIRNSLHFRIRASECIPATFLKTTLSQCSRTTRKFFISSALSGSRDPTFYKDYKLHSWCCWCCSFAGNVVLVGFCFSLIISESYLYIFSESMSIRDGEGRAELGIGGCCCCGLWAQKGGPAIGWTTSLQKCANFCESFIACALIFNAM